MRWMVLVVGVVVGCVSEDDGEGAARRLSAEGEACTKTDDCDPPLVCIDQACAPERDAEPEVFDVGLECPVGDTGQLNEPECEYEGDEAFCYCPVIQ